MSFDVNGEFRYSLYNDLEGILKSIPQPYFVTTLFNTEEPVMICRPLFEPYTDYAITHTGILFKYKPLKTLRCKPYGHCIDPNVICIPKYINNRPMVVLTSAMGRHEFFLDRLVLDRFYDVYVEEDVLVEYADGDCSNPHINNLEAC